MPTARRWFWTTSRCACPQAAPWCRANPLECGQLVAQHVDLLTPEAVADALPHSQLEAVPVAAARSEIDFFYQQLFAQNPSLLGGKLPDAGLFGSV